MTTGDALSLEASRLANSPDFNLLLLLLLLLLSLPSAYADDEVSTSLLHLLRSLARTVAVDFNH